MLAVAGSASAAYGLSRAISATSAMRFYRFWYVLAVVLMLPFVLMVAGLWSVVPPALCWVAVAVLGALVAYECALFALVWRHMHDTAPQELDWILVLGARVSAGVPSRTFVRRLDGAYAYLAANPRTRCIVCGGKCGNKTVSEAQVGADYLVARGIDDNRIVLEDKSRTTAENLKNAAALVDMSNMTVGVVTSNYHVARSLALARKAGIRRVCGMSVASAERLPLNDIVRESFAWAKDVLDGHA